MHFQNAGHRQGHGRPGDAYEQHLGRRGDVVAILGAPRPPRNRVDVGDAFARDDLHQPCAVVQRQYGLDDAGAARRRLKHLNLGGVDPKHLACRVHSRPHEVGPTVDDGDARAIGCTRGRRVAQERGDIDDRNDLAPQREETQHVGGHPRNPHQRSRPGNHLANLSSAKRDLGAHHDERPVRFGLLGCRCRREWSQSVAFHGLGRGGLWSVEGRGVERTSHVEHST